MKGIFEVRSWKKLMLTGIILCSAVLFGTNLMAHGGYMHQGKWWQSQKQAQGLNLTNGEKQALDALYVKNRDTLIDLKSTLMKDHFKLHDMLEKDIIDETSVLAQNKVIEEDKLKVSNEHIKYMLGIRKILGPDRYHQFTARFHEMMERKHGKEGHRSLNKEQL
jgi:Spy/CpxP family protein refolding chaperone